MTLAPRRLKAFSTIRRGCCSSSLGAETNAVNRVHRARGGKVLGHDERKPNNLLTFMREVARRTRRRCQTNFPGRLWSW